MIDYTELQGEADDILTEAGSAIILRRMILSGPAYEPTKTPTDYPTTGVATYYSQREVDDKNVFRFDRKVFVAAGPLGAIEPTSADFLIVGGKVHSIVSVKEIKPADIVVMYEIQARV